MMTGNTRHIYFHLSEYPEWTMGGNKYHSYVFDHLKQKHRDVRSFGHGRLEKRTGRNKVAQVCFALLHTLRIPRGSIIVLSNSLFFPYTFPLVLNRWWKKHTYAVIVHHLVSRVRPSLIRDFLERNFIKRAHTVIANSHATRENVFNLSVPSNNITVVQPGLDVDRKNIPVRKTFPQTKTILFAGSIEERKGVIYLIDSLKYLSLDDFEVHLVGKIQSPSGYYRGLRERIVDLGLSDHVHFHGRVDHSRLEQFYMNATVFVLPSLWEGFGMVVAEAMAYGLPVVASRIPALEELIESGKEGILVTSGDPLELGNALDKVLTDDRLMATLSRNARLKAESLSSWEEQSEKIWQVLTGS